MILRPLLALGAAALAAAPAAATITFYETRAAWEAAVSNPTLVTDFEDLGYGSLGHSHSWGNVTVANFESSASGDPTVADGATFGYGGHVLNNSHILVGGMLTVAIDGGTYAFGLDMQSRYDSDSFLWFGDLLDSPTIGYNDGDGFIGFVSDELVTGFGIYPLGGPIQIDNLSLASLPNQGGAQPAEVPEPAMLGLFGLGALGLGLTRRRR